MDAGRALHMIGGVGDSSYANNSSLQKVAISNSRSVVEDSILDLYSTSFPESLNIADLGCSSGPNTLLVIKEIIDGIYERCHQLGHRLPEFRLFLNDLPGNDFNTIFRSLPKFDDTLKEEKGLPPGTCFIAGVPGSFYGRLFPRNFLDFVHSSYCVHWLSQVPQRLQSETGHALNKGHIYIAKSSPPAVFEAYLDQFQRDFSLFLHLRSEEMTSGGRMVLTMIGRQGEEPTSGGICLWELLAQALKQMISQGVIQESKVDSFNLPYYSPSVKELKAVISMEGSFVLDRLQITEINWDDHNNYDDNEGLFFDKKATVENVVKCIRAVTESMLASHFGEEIINELFERYADKVGEHLEDEEDKKHVNITFSMTKKF